MKKITTVLVVFTVFICFAALLFILIDEQSYSVKTAGYEELLFTGEYVTNEGVHKAIPKNYQFKGLKNSELKVTGHFSLDIPQNLCIVTKIENLYVKMYVNDILLWEHGIPSGRPHYIKSSGNMWASFISTGIKSTDKIDFHIIANYPNQAANSFSVFFKNMRVGHERNMIIKKIESSVLNSFVSIFTISMGIAVLIFSAFVFRRHKEIFPFLVVSGFMYIFYGIWFFIDFSVQSYFFPYPIFNNSLGVVSEILSIAFMMLFFYTSIKNPMRICMAAVSVLWFLTAVVLTYQQMNGIADYYSFIKTVNGGIIVSVVLIGVSVVTERVLNPSKELMPIIYGFIFIVVGMAADLLRFYHNEYIFDFKWFKVGVHFFLLIFFIRMIQIARYVINENARISILEKQAKTDSFTGLYNKSSTESLINNYLASENTFAEYAFIISDIDNFKKINDTYGHATGDMAIKKIAEIFKTSFRQEDIIGRIGGDEFVIFVPIGDKERFKKKLDEILLKLRTSYIIENNKKIYFTVSMGVSLSPKCGRDFATLYKNADKALYKAKEDGKDRFIIFGESFLIA